MAAGFELFLAARSKEEEGVTFGFAVPRPGASAELTKVRVFKDLDLSSTSIVFLGKKTDGQVPTISRDEKAHNLLVLPARTSILANLVPKTMTLLTKFPYNKEGHPHWDAMKQLFNMGAHESYTGASYYEEHEIMMEALEMAMFVEDRPWCLEYTKEAFVKGWNKTKKQYEFWQLCGQRI